MLKTLTTNPKTIFLIDGLGALLTAIMLGFVLTNFEVYFGMPRSVLHCLAVVACVFMLYSLACYVFLKNRWRTFLSIIMVANLLYCGLTIILASYFYSRLTPLGIAYFLLECLVILGFVWLEKRVYQML